MTVGVFVDGMVKLMLAKFMLNDLPHSLLEELWVDDAWRRLLSFCDIKSIPLREAVRRDVEGDIIKRSALAVYKKVMAGYYLIAINEAPDYVVDDVYRAIEVDLTTLKKEVRQQKNMSVYDLARMLRREEGIPEDRLITRAPTEMGFLPAVERILWADSFFPASGRRDKVITVDAVMSMIHDEGTFICILIGQGIRSGDVETATGYVLDALAG